MNRNHQVALEMLDEIDRARSGVIPLDELEQRLWRLLDSADAGFPPRVASRVEDLVLSLQRLQSENLSFHGHDADENRGTEVLFNEVAGELSRFLG